MSAQTNFAVFSLSVKCPHCSAAPGVACTIRGRTIANGYHIARGDRAVTAEAREGHAQHERSVQALRDLRRITRGGRNPERADKAAVVAVLACGCSWCCDDSEVVARELHRLGLLAVEAVAR